MDKNNAPHLTHTEVCTLMAHETVALLDTADTLDTANLCRSAMEAFCTAWDLGEDGEALLIWVDMELEGAKQFAAEGKDSLHLIDSERLLGVPDAAAQMDVAWALFETAVMKGCGSDVRQVLLNAARTFAEVGGLDDLIRTSRHPDGALDAAALQTELADIRTAIQKMDEAAQADVGPCDAPGPEGGTLHREDA